jgi:outer membrane protein, heavy metal efflux system
MSNARWRAGALTLLLGAAGCASVPLETGQAHVQELLQARGEVAPLPAAGHPEAPVRQWLQEPLQLPTAVRIAMLRNPTLQLQFARLGLSAAESFDAHRLENPQLGFAWLIPVGGATGSKFSMDATLGLSDLLRLPVRGRIADSEYQRSQQLVAASIFNLGLDVERAWFECVGAQQRAALRHSIGESTQSAAELAARYHQAGNIDVIALQLQGAAASEARIASAQADAEAVEARTRLQSLMGLGPGEAAWTLPATLPQPPAATVDVAELQRHSQQQRLELAAARAEVTAAEDQLAAARHFRFLDPIHVGVAGERDADGSKRLGPAASLTLPLFNQGQGTVARAQAQLDSARAAEQLLGIQIGNDVEMQAARMRSAFEQASTYHDGLIPQREAVVAGVQLQQNYMLTDIFNLLQARQQEFGAYLGYVDAVQRYWQARVELTRAVGTRLPAVDAPAMTSPTEQP